MAPASPLPGMPVPIELAAHVNQAITRARDRVRGERVDKGQWPPNRCTDLFEGNPLGKTGAQVLAYMVLRDGTGVRNSQGVDVCGLGSVAAWTACCEHDPVVFLCSARFRQFERGREGSKAAA